jgi:hypothetical protein
MNAIVIELVRGFARQRRIGGVAHAPRDFPAQHHVLVVAAEFDFTLGPLELLTGGHRVRSVGQVVQAEVVHVDGEGDAARAIPNDWPRRRSV